MVEIFDNDEAGYLAWVAAHPDGYVANMDRSGHFPQYPVVHSAKHKLVSSANIGNFTTGDYIKLCSANLDKLEEFSTDKYGRSLTFCKNCM